MSRTCPQCNKILIYVGKYAVKNCLKRIKNGSLCRSCSKIGHVVTESTKNKISMRKKGTMCGKNNPFYGKKHTDEFKIKWTRLRKEKFPTPNKGRKFSDEWKKNMSLSRKGKIVAEYTKDLIRQKTTERISKKGWIGYNNEACDIFNKINKTFKWNGQHAKNGGEYKILGYSLDYYEPTHNIVIEYDEKHHENIKYKNKDIIRQKKIQEKLKCLFVRIKEEEKNNWKEIINEHLRMYTIV